MWAVSVNWRYCFGVLILGILLSYCFGSISRGPDFGSASFANCSSRSFLSIVFLFGWLHVHDTTTI